MEMEKEYSCLEKNSLVYHKLISNDENYQETLESYLDDILKVVKCTSRNVVTSCDVSLNEIIINGKTIINLTYCNENKELIYTDFEEEFSKTISVDEVSTDAFATAFVCNKYTSFRVINQRRIDVVSSFSIDVKLYDKSSCPCIKSCDKSKLKIQKESIINVMNSGISKIEFDEELSVASTSKGINRVVSISSSAVLVDVKIIKDKYLIKGVMNSNILYSDENNEICKAEHSFDFSKIIEMSGIDETNDILVKLSVGNTYAKAKSDNETNGSIEIFGDIYATTIVLKTVEQPIVTDGYVVGRNTKIDYSNFEICCNGNNLNKSYDKKLDFEFSSNITRIAEFDLSVAEAAIKNGKLILKFNASVLNMKDDEAECLTASVTCDYKIDCENDVALSVNITGCDYNIKSERCVSVRVNFNVQAYTYSTKKMRVLSEMNCDDAKINFPALSIYFGKADESLWDIAKSFSSDIGLIQRENDLKTDVLESNKVLIIPGL